MVGGGVSEECQATADGGARAGLHWVNGKG